MDKIKIDIKENAIVRLSPKILEILLQDHSSKQNIIWATDNYASRGFGYQCCDHITVDAITGYNGSVIKPRIEKSKQEQTERIRNKAEVFTPSWLCNKQNNLVDSAWFGSNETVFNRETADGWATITTAIPFPTLSGKLWQDYVSDIRLEISCGEAPYLVSRYDTVSGDHIALVDRIGLLDRKLRVVGENTTTEKNWLHWAIVAYKSIYGYDYQGDNVLLARENLLISFIEYYLDKFSHTPDASVLNKIAEIISWNIWQMDGLRYVIPGSCEKGAESQLSLFEFMDEQLKCPGCNNGDPFAHTGIYCKIKDWKANKVIDFISLVDKK